MISPKVLQVFYDDQCYPFKDSARAIRFPIAGGVFAGTNNTKEIRFYVDQIGGTSGISWVVVSKLPNGKIGYEVCSDVQTDSELGENYLSFDLSAYYTQVKGDLYLALRGYQGEITFTDSDSDGVYEINGDPLIEVTGTIKLAINYSPMVNTGTQVLPTDVDRMIAALSNYLLITSGIIVVRNIASQNASDYNVNQILLEYTVSGKGTFYVVHRSIGNTKVFHKMEFADLRTDQLRISDYILLTNEARLYYDDNKLKMTVNGHTLALDTSGNLTIDNVNVATNIVTLTGDSGSLTSDEIALLTSDRVLIKRGGSYYHKDYESSTVIVFKQMTEFDTAGSTYVDTDQSIISISKSHQTWFFTKLSFDFYTKSGTNSAIQSAIEDFMQKEYDVVDTTTYPTLDDFLETSGEEGYIYLYPIDTSDLTKGYYQYIWESSDWLMIGTTQIDLSNYVTLNTNQTISGLKTFSTLPRSSVVPSNNLDLTPKSYVDTKLPMVEYSGLLTIGSLPNAGLFASQSFGYYQFHKVKQGTKYSLTVIEESAYYHANNLEENDTMNTYWSVAKEYEIATCNETNEFVYPQMICASSNGSYPLDLSSGPSANADNGTYITFYTRNFGTNIGSIGVKSRKPAFKNNYGVDDYLVLESDFNELKAMFYETTVDVQDYNLTYATYSALPTSLSSQPIIFSAGTDVVGLKGRSYVVNQFVRNGSFASSEHWYTESGVTLSISGNVATISSTPASSGIYQTSDSLINGHKYLGIVKAKSDNSSPILLNIGGKGTGQININSSWQYYFVITERPLDATSNRVFGCYLANANTSCDISNVNVIDLTKWFGSNDAIPNDLLTTPSLFLTKYWKGDLSYNTGTIVDSKPNKLISYGFNSWDEETQLGYYDVNTGGFVSVNSILACKNPMQIVGGKQYYVKCPGETSAVVLFYDANGVYMHDYAVYANQPFNTPINAKYIKFYMNAYGATYNHDICINVSNASLSGTYQPYIAPSETPITSNVLRSAGSVQDTNEKVNVGVVDLGALTWYYDATFGLYCQITDLKNQGAAICPLYKSTIIAYDGLQNKELTTNSAGLGSHSYLIIKDTSYNDANTFKTAMSGVYLNYELATPTDQNPAITLPENITIQKGGSVEIQYASGYETPCDITFEMATNKLVEE